MQSVNCRSETGGLGRLMAGFDLVTPRRSRMPCPLPLVEGKCSKRHYVNSCPGASEHTIRLCLTTAGCLFIGAAQDQPAYVRDACVKVAPGQSAEYAAMLRDVTAKQMRVRIDDGHAAWWLALSSVVPAGAQAVALAACGHEPHRSGSHP